MRHTLNTLAAFAGAILCVVALLVLGGCVYTGPPVHWEAFHWRTGLLVVLGTVAVLGVSRVAMLGLERFVIWVAMLDVAGTKRLAGAVVTITLVVMFFAVSLTGCAALPMPFQPSNTLGFDSTPAEASFVGTDLLDTLQTSHLREVRNPQHRVTCNHEADPIAAALYGGSYPSKGRVLITNAVLLTVHTMVASWLDDRIAAESAKNDANEPNNLGPWYVGRVAFHAVSLAYSAGSVINNMKQKCEL